MTKREQTKKLMVGNVAVGGDAAVTVQSMCNTKTWDVDATIAQIMDFTGYESGGSHFCSEGAIPHPHRL